MRTSTSCAVLLTAAILFINLGLLHGQSAGLKTITENELRYHLGFLGAEEFNGRMTPSAELEIATLYLANIAKEFGVKPILKDGSFYQEIPLTISSVFEANTFL